MVYVHICPQGLKKKRRMLLVYCRESLEEPGDKYEYHISHVGSLQSTLIQRMSTN